jgi:beta-ketodecanoyl-[acyl-carrier-protein] synthase
VVKVFLTGTGLFTPPHSISNEELVHSYNAWVKRFNEEHQEQIDAGELEARQPSNVEFIVKASGIKSRFVIDKEGILNIDRMKPFIPERSNEQWSLQCEMSVGAANEALEQAGKQAQDVDAVIVACSNFQRAYPAVAVEVQAALGVDGFAYDMNVACSSATFGIQAAFNAIQAGSANSVLVINPEICSGHLNFCDRDSHFIFGDACTAVLIENEQVVANKAGTFELLGTKLETRFSNNIRNNFGFLNRCDEGTEFNEDKLFRQEGRKVFKEVTPRVAQLIQTHLASHDIALSQLSRVWLHQANGNMNRLIAQKLFGKDVTDQQSPTILDTYANTSSAGSIIAFHKYKDDLKAGSYSVICSFGAGYSMGSVVLKKH